MKKIFALLLAVVMTLGLLAGCGTAAETPDTEARLPRLPLRKSPPPNPPRRRSTP